MASTHFSDFLQILQKSGQFFPELDQRQEFCRDGLHSYDAASCGMEPIPLNNLLIIQPGRNMAAIYRIFAVFLWGHGGRSIQNIPYGPTHSAVKRN